MATRLLLVCLLSLVSIAMAGRATVKLASRLDRLLKQQTMSQGYLDDISRKSGQSGIKLARLQRAGVYSFQKPHFTARGVSAMHSHTDHKRTVGMGEVIATVNGVEFHTRHNDHTLRMPVYDKTFLKTMEIPLPEVPPSVANKPTVPQQVKEMQEYFKAWAENDIKHRDFRPYFIPVISYLEGAFTTEDNIKELDFHSKRHFLDADSFTDMDQFMRFNAYAGAKDSKENQCFWPNRFETNKEGKPQKMQFFHRLMCQPLYDLDLPLSSFVLNDDLTSRMRNQIAKGREMLLGGRYGRFTSRASGCKTGNILDCIMSKIPGLDNQGANIVDDAYGIDKGSRTDDGPLNAAYYHRQYERPQLSKGFRGYSDDYLFVASTTQEKIAEYNMTHGGNTYSQRVSYAFPMEIIYLTPLTVWNPYGIVPDDTTVKGFDGLTEDTPLPGTSGKNYYITPIEFFGTGEEGEPDPADTAAKSKWMKGADGKGHECAPSGLRINFPPIPGVNGKIRQRNIISPVYGEGSTNWIEVDALKSALLDVANEKVKSLYRADISSSSVNMKLCSKDMNAEGAHCHLIPLTKTEQKELAGKGFTNVKSGPAFGQDGQWLDRHIHQLTISGFKVYKSPSVERFALQKCANQDGKATWMECPSDEDHQGQALHIGEVTKCQGSAESCRVAA